MDTNPMVSSVSGQGGSQQPTTAPVNHTTTPVSNDPNTVGSAPDVTRYIALIEQAIAQNPNPHDQATAIAEVKKQYLKFHFNVDLPSVTPDSVRM